MIDLSEFYSSDGPERCGIIIGDEVVELDNISETPEDSFEISTEDLIQYADSAEVFWHTHPGGSSNLSFDDYTSMLSWPAQRHAVIGIDGTSEYYMKNGVLLRND